LGRDLAARPLVSKGVRSRRRGSVRGSGKGGAIGLFEQIKIAVHKRDAPCQSLIRMWLSEKVG